MKKILSAFLPVIIAGLILAFIFGFAVLCDYLITGFKPYHYEYIDADGVTREAVYCSIPYRQQASCRLKDGTNVLEIRSFKRVVDEAEDMKHE